MSERHRNAIQVQGLGQLDTDIYRRWIETALVIVALGFGSVLVANLFLPGRALQTVTQGIVVVVALGSLIASRKGHVRLAVLVPLMVAWVELQTTLPIQGVLGDYGVVALPPLVLVVGLAFGPRAAFALAAVSTVSTTALVVFAHKVGNVVAPDPGLAAYALVVTSAAMFATAGIVSVAVRAFASVLSDARLSEQRFADMIAHAPDGILVMDADESVVAANPASEDILGNSEAELTGRTLGDILTELQAQTDGQSLRQLSEPNEEGSPSLVWWSAGNRAQWMEITSRAFSLGGEVGKQIMLRDVTVRQHAVEEQRVVRDRLEEAQRLEAVGRLAGGIAHDFRNLLTVVSNSAELIAEDTEGEANRLAQEIQEASGKAASLTRQLLAFARREIIQTEALDVPEVVHFMEIGMRHLLGPHVHLDLALDEDVPTVVADRSQVEQILFNLVKNAADALGGSGGVEISVVRPGGRSTGPIGSFHEVPAGFVEIRVSDDGPGMDAEVLERAFEPFFTTKAIGEGTGLGLSSVHGIVTQNGGQIRLESRPGEGTSVQVLWPLGEPQRPEPQTQ